ncbi:hypothetical protein [uncultured Gammaproteobacteria bacterium]|nr:hypothetical protein [uncultured Gammaproteobacteria bacterium]
MSLCINKDDWQNSIFAHLVIISIYVKVSPFIKFILYVK